jgi:two-component system, NtrC family, sensor histidine kinase KinB
MARGVFAMRFRRLRSRFLLSNTLLVLMTAATGVWSVYTFAELSVVVDNTLDESQETTDLAATLATALEREDDALLRIATEKAEDSQAILRAVRKRFDESFSRLARLLTEEEEKAAADSLRRHADLYRTSGDRMLNLLGKAGIWESYHLEVNQALRGAVADCGAIRELNFRRMKQAGVQARDEARKAAFIVGLVLLAAIVLSTLVAFQLARAVVPPIREMTRSVEAIRTGDFASRVVVSSNDELGRLAEGFNQMAEALSQFHRSNLGEILRAKETLEATLAALPDAVFVVAPDGEIVATNPIAQEVFRAMGVGSARQFEELPLPPSGQGAIYGQLRGERADGPRPGLSQAFTVQFGDRQSKLLPIAMPIPDFQDGQRGAVVVLYDVTDFARLDEMRMEMIAVTSHELKTPLTSLRMNLMLLRERDGELTPLFREVLATAANGCEELASTVDELLDLTRIESGQFRLALDRVDLVTLVEHSARKYRPRFEERDITLSCLYRCHSAIVSGDATRLRVVLSNILTNSLKYTPQGGKVSIVISEKGGSIPFESSILQIAVTDSGPGIPRDFRERIFEKFFRLEQLRPHSSEGLQGVGIGLYLCRQIIAMHGGSIHCLEAEGAHGARFVIEIPPTFRT